jgi:hypothetical protein
MSIATDEAEQWAQSRYSGSVHIENIDGRPIIVPNFPQKTNLRREGYIAGRTAEPTEAEIEAGAIAIFSRLTTSAHHMGNDDYVDAWHCIAPEQREEFRAQSKAVLEDARKAVTGDERGY